MLELHSAVVVVSATLPPRAQKAVAMLVEEVEKRTRVRWPVTTARPQDGRPAIIVDIASSPLSLSGRGQGEGVLTPEGYHLHTAGNAVLITGNDERGVLYGVGHLLRTLHMSKGTIVLPTDVDVITAPRYRLRGHQIGYRDKVNSYDGWDLPQWEQYLRDLAVFGANAVEMIPPRSDDNPTSVHFPRPPLEMMAGVSRLADEYGLDVWLWYPAMDDDYSKPETVEFALREWAEVFRALPRLDAVFVPGGDPGHAPPRLLFSMLARQAEQLKAIHPTATWWISPQGFSKEWMDEFLTILRHENPRWLTGVVHGPWVHMTMAEFRKLIPERYPIRNYPDITHTLNCQYAVPDWDIAYALTVGREPINPRPLDEAAIFHATQPGTIGFLAYCEGCHDDVNKAIWSSLGWDPDRPVLDILREYSRYFIGPEYTDSFAQGLLALERNWRGPLAVNSGVYTTLQQFQALEEAASPWTLKNWRFLQALYRAYYDAYVRSRLLYEMALEEQAMDVLRQAARLGTLTAVAAAEGILDRAITQPVSQEWRRRVFQLAEALFQSPAHMQLSVHLYQGQEEVRGANLDGMDYPLNNRPWLKERFAAIRQLDGESEHLAAIKEIVEWTNPGPGGFYDDLGAGWNREHVAPGKPYAEDPAFLQTPMRKYYYRKDPRPWRLSWRGHVGTLNDFPLTMHYIGLDPQAQYMLRVVYSDQQPQIKIRCEANGIEVHPFIHKAQPRQHMEFAIPKAATASGSLTLTWMREPGKGGSGTGCEISEIWILKKEG